MTFGAEPVMTLAAVGPRETIVENWAGRLDQSIRNDRLLAEGAPGT
jgi:hypothetical protein